MPTPGLLGKRPAVRPYGLSELAAYFLRRPPSPPPSVAVPSVADWGMEGNDQYGDCVMAGAAHALMAWNVEVKESDPIPAEQAVVDQYLALTGGQDSGLVIADTLQHWHTDGLFGGNRIAGYAPVNVRSIPDIHMAIAFYGVCKVGIACPESAEEQFAAGKPWTPVPGSPILGGHDIELVAYDAHYLYAVTWGAVVAVSYPFAAAYADEGWAMIPQAFVEAGRGPALDLAALKADMGSLAA